MEGKRAWLGREKIAFERNNNMMIVGGLKIIVTSLMLNLGLHL